MTKKRGLNQIERGKKNKEFAVKACREVERKSEGNADYLHQLQYTGN